MGLTRVQGNQVMWGRWRVLRSAEVDFAQERDVIDGGEIDIAGVLG